MRIAGPGDSRRHASALETISVTVLEAHVPFFEEALSVACTTIGIFEADDAQKYWRIEGVKDIGHAEDLLADALALAAAGTGETPELVRARTEAEGWLARTYEAFPQQDVGRRFAICGTHLEPDPTSHRLTVRLDAGIAFGSGEHGSTRGCLRALEAVAYRNPRRILDMGCGSGILGMAASLLLNRASFGVDIEPWSVRVANSNAKLNGLSNSFHAVLGNGWRTPGVASGGPYDLVFANILARPLCRMSGDLTRHLAPGGTAILAGLLRSQGRMVLAAHRRHGLVLERWLHEGEWSTLVLRKRG